MPHSKTLGGQQASQKFPKQDAQKHGLGVENAPGHTTGSAPGEKPVASDSGNTRKGVETVTNQPGEKGIVGPAAVSSAMESGEANMK